MCRSGRALAHAGTVCQTKPTASAALTQPAEHLLRAAIAPARHRSEPAHIGGFGAAPMVSPRTPTSLPLRPTPGLVVTAGHQAQQKPAASTRLTMTAGAQPARNQPAAQTETQRSVGSIEARNDERHRADRAGGHLSPPDAPHTSEQEDSSVPNTTSVTRCQVHRCAGACDTRLIDVTAACCRGSSRPRASITGPAGPAVLL